MEGKKIKSALEIAMEKAAEIPELTREELREQKQGEDGVRGRAIANRYLERTLRERDLEIELGKYQGEEREIVRKAFLLALCQSIGLKDMEKTRRVLEGIQSLEANGRLEEIGKEIENIFGAFQQERQQRYLTLEQLEKDKLGQLWIWGSAAKPNLEENKDWRKESGEIQFKYDLRINKLKEELSHYIEPN